MTLNNLPLPRQATLAESLISDLRALYKERLILPEDGAYDRARTPFYGGIDRRPAAIVRAADANDVARLVQIARQAGLELAVRSGGHSVAGHSVSDGGIVLDLSPMKDLHIDIDRRTAWAQAGLTAGEYTTAVSQHGLATGFGDTASVGISGLTLGGGVGYLVRKYGLTIDDLLAVEVVTADGRLLQVDSASHPDLFWALRGGGGNFGVATRFQFRLHEISTVFGGLLVLPATPEVIAGFIAAAEAAPDKLSTIANIMTAPPMPFLPKEVVGKPVVLAMLVYAGDVEAGQRVTAPFVALAAPLANLLHPMRYPEIYQPEPEGYHPIAASRTMFIDHVDRATAETILDYLNHSTASMAATQLRVLGGAMGRVADDATAFAHRQSRIMANVAALYGRPEEKRVHEDWASLFASALRQDDGGAYVNFLGDEGPEQVRAAYPGRTWERLAAVKALYDPTNFFHLNQNIPPQVSPAHNHHLPGKDYAV